MSPVRSLVGLSLSALLAAGALSSPAQAQKSHGTTSSDFSVRPARTDLPFFGMTEPYFRVVDGMLSLIETKPNGAERDGVYYIYGPPIETTLWSKPLDTAPINFMFEVGEYD